MPRRSLPATNRPARRKGAVGIAATLGLAACHGSPGAAPVIPAWEAEACVPGLPDGHALWEQGYALTGNDVQGVPGTVAGVAADAAGDVIVVGTFAGEVDFGCGVLRGAAAEGCAPQGESTFVAKLDPDGACLWSKAFSGETGAGGRGGVIVTSLALDAAGDVILAGGFGLGTGGSVDFGLGVLTTASDAAFVVELDPGGAPLWSRSFAGQAVSVAVDGRGDVAVAGAFVTGPDTSGTPVGVLDPGGAPLWGEVLANTTRVGVAMDAGGDVFVSGSVQCAGAVDLGCGPLAGAPQSLLAKLGPNGACLWSVPRAVAFASGVAVDGAGDVLAAGEDGNDEAPRLDLAQFTSDGAAAWDLAFPGDFLPPRAAVDGTGDVFYTSGFQGVVQLGEDMLDNDGLAGAFVAAAGADGSPRWAVAVEGQVGTAIAVDGSCHVVVGGTFQGALDGGLPDTGGGGVFVGKFVR